MEQNHGDDIYGKIHASWNFLHTGLALNHFMGKNTIEPISDFNFLNYKFETDIVRQSIPGTNDFYTIDNYSNFSIYIFLTSAKDIFSWVIEGINKDKKLDELLDFSEFLKKELGSQYDAYVTILKFCRNTLSHNITKDFTLISEDFKKQKDYINKKNLPTEYSLNITYQKFFHIGHYQKGSFNIDLDFEKVVVGEKFFSLIGDENLMHLVRFSASIVELYVQKRSAKFFEDTH